MKRITPNGLVRKINEAGLTHAQVYKSLGVGQGWFKRMRAGDYVRPNPAWMQSMHDFCDDYIEIKAKHRIKKHTAFYDAP